MKRAELERLRALLRETDPAAEVEGMPPEQRARVRRTVLAAVPEPGAGGAWLRTRDGFVTRQWAFATLAVALLVAAGAGLLRVLDGAPALVDASRLPVQATSPTALAGTGQPAIDADAGTDDAEADADSDVGVGVGVDVASLDVASQASPPEPRVASRAASSGREPSAAPPRPPLLATAAAEPEAMPVAAAPAAAPVDAGGAGDSVAIAAFPAPLGRQIQVTAPGGTRIVWILTPSTGP